MPVLTEGNFITICLQTVCTLCAVAFGTMVLTAPVANAEPEFLGGVFVGRSATGVPQGKSKREKTSIRPTTIKKDAGRMGGGGGAKAGGTQY
jgi:hypothetical protein